MLIDASGRHDSNFFMVFDENTQVYGSSSVTWRNQFFVFGGKNNKRQISKLSEYKLTSVGKLAFKHYRAASTIAGNDLVYLCFNSDNTNDYKKCRTASGPLGNFTETPHSTYSHKLTKVASSSGEFNLNSARITIKGYTMYLQSKLKAR